MRFREVLAGMALIVLAPAMAPARAADSLERQLVRRAPQVIKLLKAKRCANVGVLKFLVVEEGKTFSDNVGTLNLTLARQLEVALLLANDPLHPIGIIEDASAVASRTPGADHRTRAGRLKLFGARYPLAWGKEVVQADVFLTGTAGISADLQTVTVNLLYFDRQTNNLEELGDEIKAENRPDRLSEIGASFLLRGAFDGGEVEPTPAREKKQASAVMHSATRVKEGQAKHPAEEAKAPVKLEVRYDGRAVPLEVRDGKAFIREPLEGQKVAFVLRRDSSKERYGVVLKVNGENTLYRQRLPDLECSRWILDPGDGPMLITGYQRDARTEERFKILSATESKEREFHYGADVGTITLTVFCERRGKPKPPDDSDEAEEAAVVARPELPPRKASNYNALKAQLLEGANRGLIVEGQHAAGKVRAVPFNPDPVPRMSLTVVYYRR